MGWLTLDPKDAQTQAFARATFPGYHGKHFHLQIAESVDVTHSYWSSGSRSTFAAFTLTDPPMAQRLPTFDPIQFGGPTKAQIVTLRPGYAVAQYHEGSYEYVMFHLHAADAAPLLPSAPADLSEDEKFVLSATCGLTSAGRKSARERRSFSDERWKAARALLEARGYVSKQGAALPDGRNVCDALKLRTPY